MHGKLERVWINGGDAGIRQTLEYMRRKVYESDDHRIIKDTASRIIQNVNPKNRLDQIRSIVFFVKNKMRYVRDIDGVEEIQSPWVHVSRILAQGSSYGDCDDFSVLTVSLLRAVGFHTAFDAIASGSRGQDFDHVRTLVEYENKWLPLETTAKDREIGWEPKYLRRMTLKV